MKYATLKTRLSCIPRICKQRGCKFKKECKLSATAVLKLTKVQRTET